MKKTSSILTFTFLLGLAAPIYAEPVPYQRDGAPDPNYEVPEELNLDYALAFALDNNHAIRQARERIREQEGIVLEVNARRIPTVSASGRYTRIDPSLTNPFNPSNQDWAMQIQASEVLYAGGGVTASNRGASLVRKAAELELQGVINEQLLLVRTKFYNVLLTQQKIAVQEENIKLLEEQLKNAHNRFAAGATSNFEVLRAEVSLANGRPDLITARNDYRLAIEGLRQVIGLAESVGDNLTKGLKVVGTLAPANQVTFDLHDALVSARSNRPELQRLSKLEMAGEKLVTVAKSGARPVVSLVGQYQWLKGYGVNGWENRLEGWTLGLQTQWNIFDGMATKGRVAQAKSRLIQTKLAVEESILAIDVEVRQAHSSLTEAWELVGASDKVVEQADEALRLAKVRYSAGTATQLDVLTSQVELTRARLNQLQAYYRYNVAMATLRKAMGEADSYVSN